MKKANLKNFTKFPEKHLHRSLFLITLQAYRCFPWILGNSSEQFFFKNTSKRLPVTDDIKCSKTTNRNIQNTLKYTSEFTFKDVSWKKNIASAGNLRQSLLCVQWINFSNEKFIKILEWSKWKCLSFKVRNDKDTFTYKKLKTN